jgi:hypothetical protein
MGQKDDLDMQTFQIYQDDDSVPVPMDEVKEQPKKKMGFGGFKKSEPNGSGAVKSGSNNGELIKGVAIGVGLVVLFIVIDQLKLF